jgi:Na+-translocating ferredoxin:NAD+ oxidoreductase RnfC subunit
MFPFWQYVAAYIHNDRHMMTYHAADVLEGIERLENELFPKEEING